jgi:hypothetical protein
VSLIRIKPPSPHICHISHIRSLFTLVEGVLWHLLVVKIFLRVEVFLHASIEIRRFLWEEGVLACD